MKLLYFAWVRERIGVPEEEVELPPGIGTVAELVGWLRTRGPEFEAAFTDAGKGVVRTAIDRVHARPDTPLGKAREIAFFPPMTGG
jgi:molybdopterin synthase sulfur carrier subunit